MLEVKYIELHLHRRLIWKIRIEAKVTQIKLKSMQMNYWQILNSKLRLYSVLYSVTKFSYGAQPQTWQKFKGTKIKFLE